MQTEKKKVYEKPALRKVRLEVRNAVLASCFSSSSTYTAADPVCQQPFSTCVYPPQP